MLKGTLDDFTLSDVFRLLAYAKKTGRLDVARSAGAGKVFFRHGYVYFAASGLNLEPLGQKLLRSGVLKERHLRKALDQQATTGERLGRILVASGAIRSEHLAAAVREQIEDAAFELLRWEIGEFEWDEAATFDAEITMSVTVESLIMEAARRVDELDVIARKIHSVDVELGLVAEPPEGARELKILPDEWRVLVLVDGRTTVREIVRRSPFDNFMTLRTLYGLISTGLVEVLPDPEHRPVEARPAPDAAVRDDDHADAPAARRGAAPGEPRRDVAFAPAPPEADASLEDELRGVLEPAPADGVLDEPASPAAFDDGGPDQPASPAAIDDGALDEPASEELVPQLGTALDDATALGVDDAAADPAWDAAGELSAAQELATGATARDPDTPEPATDEGDGDGPEPAGEVVEPAWRAGEGAPPPPAADVAVPRVDTAFADLLDDGSPPAPPAPRAITLPDEPPSRVDRADVVRELAGLFSDEEPARSRPGPRPDAPPAGDGEGDGGGRGGLMSRFGRRPG